MYNEIDNLRKGVLSEVYNYLKKQSYSWEVLVVDDLSTDKSLAYVKKFAIGKKGIRILAEPHRGKGGTVIAGMLAGRGEIILFTDMDQATPLNQIEKFFPHFKHADIVIGSRSGREGAPLIRKSMATGFSILRTLVLRLPYKDTQCGFKAFRRSAAHNVFKRMKVFNEKHVQGAAVTAGFDLEFLYIARKLELVVDEVPVDWHHVGSDRVNFFSSSWQGLTDLLRVRINAFQGKYRGK